MNLHEIQNIGQRAWVWCYVMGGNGQRITRFSHLFPVQRQTPRYTIGHEYHHYFTPWRFQPPDTIEAVLTPACGRLPTRAQYPHLNDIYGRNEWNAPECRECAAQQRGQYINELNRDDPWAQVPGNDRIRTLDPITGR